MGLGSGDEGSVSLSGTVSAGCARGSDGPSLARGEHADRVGEAERDEHARDDAKPPPALGREWLGRGIADPGDRGRTPADPPATTHEPKRLPRLRIQPPPPDEQDGTPHASAADAVCRVGVALDPHIAHQASPVARRQRALLRIAAHAEASTSPASAFVIWAPSDATIAPATFGSSVRTWPRVRPAVEGGGGALPAARVSQAAGRCLFAPTWARRRQVLGRPEE